MKRVLGIGLLLWLTLCAPAWAEWALTASGHQADTQANPVTFSFDCVGADLLIVHLACTHSAGTVRGGDGPTYGGVPMTDSGRGKVASTSETSTEVWFLVNPAAGENELSIPSTSAGVNVAIVYSAWTGVDTADPLDVAASNTGNPSANPSCLITTSASGKLIVDSMCGGRSTAPSANSHTLISSVDEGTFSSNAQYTTLDGSSGITLSWTLAEDDWAHIAMALNEAGGAPPPARRIFIISGFDLSAYILILLLAAVRFHTFTLYKGVR